AVPPQPVGKGRADELVQGVQAPVPRGAPGADPRQQATLLPGAPGADPGEGAGLLAGAPARAGRRRAALLLPAPRRGQRPAPALRRRAPGAGERPEEGLADAPPGARRSAGRVIAAIARVRDLVAWVAENWGGLDVMVNNAGFGVAATTPDTAEADWDRVLAVTLTGTFYGMKYAIPALRAAGGGAVINMASVAGLVGVADRA